MNSLSSIEKIILEGEISSQELLGEYLSGNSQVTYQQIIRACRKERLAYVYNKACFGKNWLMPVMLIPVLIFCLLEEC